MDLNTSVSNITQRLHRVWCWYWWETGAVKRMVISILPLMLVSKRNGKLSLDKYLDKFNQEEVDL